MSDKETPLSERIESMRLAADRGRLRTTGRSQRTIPGPAGSGMTDKKPLSELVSNPQDIRDIATLVHEPQRARLLEIAQDYEALETKLAAAERDRDEWKGHFNGQVEVYGDLALRLVNAVGVTDTGTVDAAFAEIALLRAELLDEIGNTEWRWREGLSELLGTARSRTGIILAVERLCKELVARQPVAVSDGLPTDTGYYSFFTDFPSHLIGYVDYDKLEGWSVELAHHHAERRIWDLADFANMAGVTHCQLIDNTPPKTEEGNA